ncbi:MAG: FAD-dependent oxidoreductase, partial [Thermaerobacterales bacterium]
YGEEVAKVLKDNGVIKGIVTTGGKNIECGMLGAGLGLTLNTGFLRDTPINLGKGIIADQHLSTNVPDIYTGGDVAEFYDSFLGDHNIMGTWNNSQGHGRVAGRNMAGANDVYDDVPHYTTTMFHTTMTAIGMTPETNPRVEGETLVDFEEEIYRRLFFDGEYLVGGVLIGDMKPRRGITKMIKSREPITDRRQFIEEVGS